MAPNDRSLPMELLAGEIRTIHRSRNSSAGETIGNYVEAKFHGLPISEKLTLLEKLIGQFPERNIQDGGSAKHEAPELEHLFSMVLGKKISTENFSSPEIADKLAQSLGTVFDALNEVIGLIHSILLGEKDNLETIRHIIGSNLERNDTTYSLQNYLDKIRTGFLVAHKAFHTAARIKTDELLMELAPERMASAARGGMKIGFIRKAELYDIYSEKHRKCEVYLSSGRFEEALLREFERQCRQQFKTFRASD